jgi:hypothetical protein
LVPCAPRVIQCELAGERDLSSRHFVFISV